MDSLREQKEAHCARGGLVDDRDVDDDLLIFEPAYTAYETVQFTQKKSRKDRIFGSRRGQFGGGGGVRKRFNAVRRRTSMSSREAMDDENSALADDSSPDFGGRRSQTLSEDETCNFANIEDIPLDLCSRLNGGSDQRLTMPKTHLRSASTLQRHHTLPQFSHTRSSISTADVRQPLARRPMQRSHSLAQASSSSTSCLQSKPIRQYSDDGGKNWAENLSPTNELDAIERTGGKLRKTIRLRRHSNTSGAALTMGTRTTSSSSSLTSSAATLPLDLNWLAPESFSSRPVDLGNYQATVDAFAVLSQASAASPSAQSAASSRKRGVCGSPVSDLEDWLTLSSSSVSDTRRTRSRSRIFSPAPGEHLPSAPSLARNLEADENNISQRTRPEEEYGGRGDAMEMDDDSDDEESVQHSSPESSFEVIPTVEAPSAPMIPEDEPSKMKRVFDTMSSYDDLKYLIRMLRKENRRQGSTVIFGGGDVWKVAPPVNQSTGQRRVAFTSWTKTHLGFTVRSAGMGFTYVQISKARGAQVLETLEAALVEHKKTEQPTGDQHVIVAQAPSPNLFSSLSMPRLVACSASFFVEPPVSILYVLLLFEEDALTCCKSANALIPSRLQQTFSYQYLYDRQ